jgi:hypothetical protein
MEDAAANEAVGGGGVHARLHEPVMGVLGSASSRGPGRPDGFGWPGQGRLS